MCSRIVQTISYKTFFIVHLVSFIQDWRDMCKAYNVEESDVPHRHGKITDFASIICITLLLCYVH